MKNNSTNVSLFTEQGSSPVKIDSRKVYLLLIFSIYIEYIF
jgi:hypothetical protein